MVIAPITLTLLAFREIWLVDFEFHALAGENPVVICMVARELRTGRTIRLWQDELYQLHEAPFPTGADCLFVAFYASAEMGCFLALGWPMPEHVLDLFVEFRNHTNGRTGVGSSIVDAMAYLGLDAVDEVEKASMRALAIRGGPFTDGERIALTDYCGKDVIALDGLIRALEDHVDLPRALLRGRYMKAAARMERNGVPIDVPMLQALLANWAAIQERLVAAIDVDYGVYDGATFKADRWARWLADHHIPWPTLESGAFALDDETFRLMARCYQDVAPIRELRWTLAQLRLTDLAVGADGRNRTLLSAFRARTGRNAPSNSKFIFGPSTWLRSLIKPAPGTAIAYVDWEQQEFGIAAALSGDPAMIAAYLTGDPYLAFAKQAGAAPPSATKKSHGEIRELFKTCALAVLFSMGPFSLAGRIGGSLARARDLLRLHRTTYPRYWAWSDAAVSFARGHNHLFTAFGWRLNVGADTKVTSLRNYLMQGNGSEMLRLACCLATERDIRIIAPVHDALLVEATIEDIEHVVAEVQELMAQASALVLAGFTLRSEVKVVLYPDRYMDARGERMWNTVVGLLPPAVPTASMPAAVAHP